MAKPIYTPEQRETIDECDGDIARIVLGAPTKADLDWVVNGHRVLHILILTQSGIAASMQTAENVQRQIKSYASLGGKYEKLLLETSVFMMAGISTKQKFQIIRNYADQLSDALKHSAMFDLEGSHIGKMNSTGS